MNDGKAVLVVGGGILQTYMLHEAKSLGLFTICTDSETDCPGAQQADKFIHMDTYDVDGHKKLGENLRGLINGVVTCGADVAPAVSAAAEGSCVPGIPLTIAKHSHNKARVRQAIDEASLSIYQPRWYCLSLRDSQQNNCFIQFPLIIKPLSQRASRGVTIVHHEKEIPRALEKAAQYGGEVLIEEYLLGSEHSAEMILGNDGAVIWLNIVDRYFDYSSNIPIELGHVNPTSLDEHQQQQILLMVLAAARALGVKWGAFKIDCMMTADGPKVLECTARLSGGWDCQWSSPATGRHPMRVILQLACGLPIGRQPTADGYGAVAAIIPQQYGRVQTLPRSEQIIWTVQPGDVLRPLEHNAQRCGYAMAHRTTSMAAWEKAATMAEAYATLMEIVPL